MEDPGCVSQLFVAVKLGMTDIVRKLLEENSNLILTVNVKGQTPLHLACLQNDSELVALLLSKQADCEVKDLLGHTSFDIAYELGHLGIITQFLLHNNKIRVTPALLRKTVEQSHLELLKIIVQRNIDACNAVDDDGENILHFCVKNNNLDTTKILTDRVNINCSNNYGQTPLHIAVIQNFSEIAKFLLFMNPDTANFQDLAGYSALHYAIKNNNVELVKDFIKTGANIELINGEGMTPLHVAMKFNCWKSFFELLDHNANIHVTDNEDNTPLHTAVINNSLEITKILLSKNASLLCQNIYDQTPFHIALVNNNPDIIEVFRQLLPFHLSSPNVVNIQDSNGNTPLHIATMNNNYLLVEDLVNKGAKLDLRNYNGQTALNISIQEDCNQSFDVITRHGVDVNIRDEEGKSPLHLSASKGVLSVVGKLVQLGADLELKDNRGSTPIHYAAKYGFPEVLKFLHFSGSQVCNNDNEQTLIHVALENCVRSIEGYRNFFNIIKWLLFMGVDIKAQDKNGDTAIHYAAREGLFSFLNHLKNHNYKISIGQQNKDGQTALHLAALRSWKIFDLLLGEQADPYVKDFKGVNPFELLTENYNELHKMPMIHYCVSSRLINITNLLLDQNTDIETECCGDTPLIHAVRMGLNQETKFLIEKGADINAKDYNGETALHIALTSNLLHIAETLIRSGADLDTTNVKGRTPLHIALRKEEISSVMFKSLLDHGARIDALDFKSKTPLDYISSENMEDRLIKPLIRQNLIMLETVNMLSIPVKFSYDGFEYFHECCLEEIKLMKLEKYGRNSLYDIFLNFRNPTYIFNVLLETKINSVARHENETYPIYSSLLENTFKRAKVRYRALQKAQCFFKLFEGSTIYPKLPGEVERMILYYLSNDELQTLVVLKDSLQTASVTSASCL